MWAEGVVIDPKEVTLADGDEIHGEVIVVVVVVYRNIQEWEQLWEQQKDIYENMFKWKYVKWTSIYNLYLIHYLYLS